MKWEAVAIGPLQSHNALVSKNWDRHLATRVFHSSVADGLGASPIF